MFTVYVLTNRPLGVEIPIPEKTEYFIVQADDEIAARKFAAENLDDKRWLDPNETVCVQGKIGPNNYIHIVNKNYTY